MHAPAEKRLHWLKPFAINATEEEEDEEEEEEEEGAREAIHLLASVMLLFDKPCKFRPCECDRLHKAASEERGSLPNSHTAFKVLVGFSFFLSWNHILR